MNGKSIGMAVAALLIPTTCLLAQEGRDRGEEREREHMVRAVVQGHEFGPEAVRFARQYLRNHIFRPELDMGQSAYYSIAEIYLERGEPEKAAAKLRELATQIREPDEVLWITLFNVAQISRYRLKDTEGAVKAYSQVEGVLQPLAQAEMIDLLLEAGDGARAATLLGERLKGTQEIGERLALLNELGRIYRRAGMDVEAIKTFEELAESATPEKMAGLRRDAEAEVVAAFREIRRLQREGRWEEAEKQHLSLRRRLGRFMLQRRLDEAQAMRREIERQEREMRAFHEERERAERERRRDGDRPEEGRRED